MSTTKLIGNKIAAARRKMNISQAQLAQDLFLSSQAVGKWERGESMPDIVTFSRLAEILGVDLNYFSENFPIAPVEETVDESSNRDSNSQTLQSNATPFVANFIGSNLPKSDFAGVTAHNGKFTGSALRGSDFSGADLTGSSFKASDVREANFDGANLTDCNFYTLDLSRASFHKTILVRTNFSASSLTGAKFADCKLTDVKLSLTDLRTALFENCVFEGVDFEKSDLRGMHFDGQTFIGVKFDNSSITGVTLSGATLRNVSFRATHAVTNKYYRSLKTISFDGAQMDKLTYAVLKGFDVDMSKVSVIQG